MPDQDAVVAITSGTKDMASVMNLVWDKLLPAMQNQPLPRNDGNLNQLKNTLAHLTMHLPSGSAAPGPAAPMSGRKYIFPANDQKIESATLAFGPKGNAAALTLSINGVEQKINCGDGSWVTGRMTFAQDIVEAPEEQPVAAAGAWTEDGVYKAKLIFYQTPFYVTFTLKFSGDRLLFDTEYNVVRRGSAKQPQLIGQVQ